jgi:hypothetical protein
LRDVRAWLSFVWADLFDFEVFTPFYVRHHLLPFGLSHAIEVVRPSRATKQSTFNRRVAPY